MAQQLKDDNVVGDAGIQHLRFQYAPLARRHLAEYRQKYKNPNITFDSLLYYYVRRSQIVALYRMTGREKPLIEVYFSPNGLVNRIQVEEEMEDDSDSND